MATTGTVNLHSHTLHSDGELIPAELFRRVEVAGLEGSALTDHADASSIDRVVEAALVACRSERKHGKMLCAGGVEITHARPGEIPELVARARELGAEWVAVHGESPVEPVEPGTNRAAIEAGCDFLAHPGYIEPELVKLAAERNVLLEISGRKGHSLTNGHVAALAREAGAKVVFGGDWHDIADIQGPDEIRSVLIGAGMTDEEAGAALATAREAILKAGK
jgi:histidinol phosphatase-like PHP family hydrolase